MQRTLVVPTAVVTLLLALLLSACGSAGGLALNNYLREHEQELTLPASMDTAPVRFVVEPGTPARVIGQNLLNVGLIRDDLLFEAYVRVNGLAGGLKAGTFVLSPNLTLVEIVDRLRSSRATGVLVTVPEGWRLEQTADMLQAKNVFSDTVEGVSAERERYKQIALSGDLTQLDASRYPFLQNRPAGAGLEGYLFPDTYELPAEGAQATDLLARQLDNFATQVVTLYEQAQASGQVNLTLHEVLTLASIVEREAVVPAERPTIAGVYLNRLAMGMKLDADPTVQYAMGYQPDSGQWWKTPVTLDEYSGVDSPYNTYIHVGLPPGPIAAPGLSSIKAVLQPEQHDFLYFVALPDGNGQHVFATNFEEHSANVARYLGGQ